MTIYYLHSRLCLLTALIKCLTVLLEYLDLFQTRCRAQQTFGRAWALPFGYTTAQVETTVSRVSHVSAILVSDYSCFMLVHSL